MIKCIDCGCLTNEEIANDEWYYHKNGKFICPSCFNEKKTTKLTDYYDQQVDYDYDDPLTYFDPINN